MHLFGGAASHADVYFYKLYPKLQIAQDQCCLKHPDCVKHITV